MAKNFYQRKKIAIFNFLTFVFLVFLSLSLPLKTEAKDLSYFKPKDFVNSFLKQTKEFIESPFKKVVVFAQGLGFFPSYPNRLRDLAIELSIASEELNQLNNNLSAEVSKCSCKYTHSQCAQQENISLPVFGDACENRQEIEKNQKAIKDKIDQISYLRELLLSEMSTGLPSERETLREEEAKELEEKLELLLDLTDPQKNNSIISPAQENINTINEPPDYSQCASQCQKGLGTEFTACFEVMGEQNPIEVNLNINLSLSDLNLGEINISEVNLNLPQTLTIPSPSLNGDLKFSLPDIEINFPAISLEKLKGGITAQINKEFFSGPIVIHPPSPPIPSFKPLELSCPNPTKEDYQCNPTIKNELLYTEAEWYYQILSYLMENCYKVVTPPNFNDLLKEEKKEKKEEKMKKYEALIKACSNPKTLVSTIDTECEKKWHRHCDFFGCGPWHIDDFPDPDRAGHTIYEICNKIGREKARNSQQTKQCRNLFGFKKVICDITVFKNKCNAIKEQFKKETDPNKIIVPEACKLLPIFTKEAISLDSQTFQENQSQCDSQTIPDNSGFNSESIQLSCPVSAGFNFSGPKIKLPNIIIPDIRLPSFNFSPFLRVKLPNFIFEDLIFPELNLCELSSCFDLYPALWLNIPKINIPNPYLIISPIEIPSFDILSDLDLSGIGSITLKTTLDIDRIEFPRIFIPFPQLDLSHFISLQMQMPKISLPSPQLSLSFSGINIDFSNLLMGLFSPTLDLGGCVTFGFGTIPLDISFPDYYFYWPQFPEIPNLCQNLENFCNNIKQSLFNKISGEISKNQNAIQNAIDNSFKNIQSDLSSIAKDIHNLINDEITKEINQRVIPKIKEKINKVVQDVQNNPSSYIQNNTLIIPPIRISSGELDRISISMDPIREKLEKLQKTVNISLPPELKEISLTTPVNIPLPRIPLSNLSYSKNVYLKLPGLQKWRLSFGADFFGRFKEISSKSPSDLSPYSNPYPINHLNSNSEKIKEAKDQINDSVSKINEILK